MSETKYIAIGVDQNGKVWRGHFGMAPCYRLYDRSGNLMEERQNPYGAGGGGKHAHHDNPLLIVNLLSDCSVFIANRMGDASKQKLVQDFGIETVLTEEKDPQAALSAYLNQTRR